MNIAIACGVATPCEAAEATAPAGGEPEGSEGKTNQGESSTPSFGQLLGGALIAAQGLTTAAGANPAPTTHANPAPTADAASTASVRLAGLGLGAHPGRAGHGPPVPAAIPGRTGHVPPVAPAIPSTVASPTADLLESTPIPAPGTDPIAAQPGTDPIAARPGTDPIAARPGTDAIADAADPTSLIASDLRQLQGQDPPREGSRPPPIGPALLDPQHLGAELAAPPGENLSIEFRVEQPLARPADETASELSGADGGSQTSHSPLAHAPSSASGTNSANTGADPASLSDALAGEAARAPAEDPAKPSQSGELGHSSARITLGEGDRRVSLWVAVRGDSVRVEARAHDAAYADVLNQRSGELASGLAERGLVLGSMSADVTGERSRHQQSFDPDDRSAGRRGEPDRPEDPTPTRAGPRGVRAIA